MTILLMCKEAAMSKKTNFTTNYPKDTHAAFCRRCMAHNNGCPITKRQKPSKKCSL